MPTPEKWGKALGYVRSVVMPRANEFSLLVLLGLAAALAGCVTEAEKAEQQMMMQQEIGCGSRPYPVSQATPLAPGVPTPAGAAQASAEGYTILQNVEVAHPKIAVVVAKQGPPDAIEAHSATGVSGLDRYIAFLYREPPRTLLYDGKLRLYRFGEFREVMEIKQVPRSTRRQAFGEGPMPPPWPVTIPIDELKAFGVPAAPSMPQPFDPTHLRASYRPISEQIQLGITAVAGEPFERASRAFARLKPNSILPGFNWRLIVFREDRNFVFGVPVAFSVPDGTIFVSDGLVDKLSDDELAAVFAHVLGHVAYGHDRWFWQEANLAEKTGAVVGTAVLAGAVIFFTGGQILGHPPGPPPSPPPEHFGVYSRDQEVQANYIAVTYLASAGIPPDTLFDSLLKLSSIEAAADSLKHYRVERSADFATMHTADRSAADLGKLLDAGMIGSVSR